MRAWTSKAVSVLTIFQNATVGIVSVDFKPYLPFDLGGINSVVRVGIALNDRDNGPTQADGEAPTLVAFDEKQDYLGTSDWIANSHVNGGTYVDVVVHQIEVSQGKSPTYLQVLGHRDAVCVAYVGQTWPDGEQRAWMGDLGRSCGKGWFYSNVKVGDDGYKPDCTWLNSDHAADGTDEVEDIQAAAVQIHMPHFSNLTESYNTDPASYCTFPALVFVRDHGYEFGREWVKKIHNLPADERMTFWNNDHGFKPKREVPPTRRNHHQPAKRSLALRSKLVSSIHDQHSAKALCESDTSHGPDFVSHSEGLFCDMGSKRAWPMCRTTEVEVGCYEWGSHSLVTGKGKEGKGYADVEEWM